MDFHPGEERNRTGSLSAPPFASQNDPTTAESAANSSVGQQSNSTVTQFEVDERFGPISLEVQRLNAALMQKDVALRTAILSDLLEIGHLRDELEEKENILSETQLRLTQSEFDKSKYAKLYKEENAELQQFQLDAKREKQMTSVAHMQKLDTKLAEIEQLRADNQSLKNELQQKDLKIDQMRKYLVAAESLKTEYVQLYKEESAKLTSVEEQLECEKEKNRQKDPMLTEHQNELTEKSTEIFNKSAEIHNKSGEILKLRQTVKSLRTQLELKSDDFLWLKSEVKSALEAELNCSICSKQMTEAVVSVECGHTFCKQCIDRWINKGHQTCPFCRSECHRSAPVVAIQQLQAKLLSCVNAERPIVTRSNGENLPIRNDNNSAANNNLSNGQVGFFHRLRRIFSQNP